jgi:hypothetical protein
MAATGEAPASSGIAVCERAAAKEHGSNVTIMFSTTIGA